MVVVLTCAVQVATSIGDAVKREIEDLCNFNTNNPSQKLAELSAIKEVSRPLPARW